MRSGSRSGAITSSSAAPGRESAPSTARSSARRPEPKCRNVRPDPLSRWGDVAALAAGAVGVVAVELGVDLGHRVGLVVAHVARGLVELGLAGRTVPEEAVLLAAAPLALD